MLKKYIRDLFFWKTHPSSFLPNMRYSKCSLNMKMLFFTLAEMWMACCITVSLLFSPRSSFQLTDRVWIILLSTSLTQVLRSSLTSSESSSPWAPGRSCRRSSRSVFLRNARSRRWGPWTDITANPFSERDDVACAAQAWPPLRRPPLVYCYELEALFIPFKWARFQSIDSDSSRMFQKIMSVSTQVPYLPGCYGCQNVSSVE